MKAKTQTSITTNNGSRMVRARRPGFTLIEIMVVTIIGAMLMGGLLNVSMHRYRRMQVEQYAKQFFLAAKYARIYAIERQEPCHLMLSQETNSFAVYGRVSPSGGETVLSNPFTRPRTMDNGIQFEKIAITPAGAESTPAELGQQMAIVFRPDGSADTAIIQIGNGTDHYSIAISGGTGKARVQLGELDELPVDVVDLDMQ
ncbi:MAG: prepilin-type N-terminal cleavage/methylation domain-containing protein [Sedimentisphaerales bacterium]|nr:prepilin-type N-terminal cleavage/methylation domain-containing protein [Sedimentisphaerales bacterium]